MVLAESKIELFVESPQILASRFKDGLQFQEIINGHRLENFEEKIDVHMLKGENTGGCRRFSLDQVTFQKQIYALLLLTIYTQRGVEMKYGN